MNPYSLALDDDKKSFLTPSNMMRWLMNGKHVIALQSAYAHKTYFIPEVHLESFFGSIRYLILQLEKRYFIDYFLGRYSYRNNRGIAYLLSYKMRNDDTQAQMVLYRRNNRLHVVHGQHDI